MNRRFLLAFAVTLSLCGCGGDSNSAGVKLFPAKGKILVDSKPQAGLIVQLKPKFDWKNEKLPLPHAVTDAEGVFLLETLSTGDGAPAGEYEVAITSPSSEGLGRISDVIGNRYADASKSGLTAKIAESETVIPNFQLKASNIESKIQKSMPKK